MVDTAEPTNWRADFLRVMRDEFQRARTADPAISLRRYAKQLGVSPGPASELLSGKKEWQFSPQWAQRVLERMNTSAEIRDDLLVRMGQPPHVEAKEFAPSEYNTLADWTYYPILMSFDLPAPHNTVEEIAKRLGVPTMKVEEVASDLIQMGWLVRDEDGQITRPKTFLQTSNGISKDAIRKFHENNLKLAAEALKTVPVEARDFQALTVVGCREDLASIKREIHLLLEKTQALMNRGAKNNDVYRLSIQLFPVSSGENNQ